MKNIFKLSLLFVVLFTSSLFASYTVIEDQVGEVILSPALQNIEKKKIRLSNGLEALVISDPGAKKSGASLSVGIGMNHEPSDCVGLAHFVEHMLFMGNEKYPEEKGYHEFIQSRGGFDNAYTSSDKTVYTFEISNEHAMEALDRFASFFVSPLFNESGLARERQAVNEELLFRITKDNIRFWMVSQQSLDPKSNASTCRCGSLETLQKISRDRLVGWYQDNYSANIMKLVVYSSKPMDQLLQQVDASFSPVPNHNKVPSRLEGPLANKEYLGKTIFIEPLHDQKSLTISWEMPPEFAMDLDYHTDLLVGSVLEEESEHSLATKLKDEGLIVGLGCGISSEDDQNAFFVMQFELTDLGLEMRDLVIEQTYAAIHALQEKGIPRYCFDEKVSLAKLNYQFQSRPNAYSFVCSAAASLQHEPLATYPKKTWWPTKYDPQRIKTFLSALEPSNARYFVMAPKKLVEKDFDQSEMFSKARYTVENIDPNLMNIWANINLSDEFKVSPPNPYIPSELKLVTTKRDFTTSSHPEIVHETEKAKVYYQADQEFQVPEVSYALFFQTPHLKSSPRNNVMADLFTFSVSEKLAPLLNQGQLAGMDYAISQNPKFGLLVKTAGYSEKSELFLTKIIKEVQNHKPTAKDFERYKSFLSRQYYNQTKLPPFQQSSQTMKALILKDYNTPDAHFEAIESVSFDDFQSYCQQLFDSVYIRGMIYGNVTQASAKAFTQDLEDSFAQSEVYPENEHYTVSVLDLGSAPSPQYYTESSEQLGSSTRLTLGLGKLNDKDRAAFEVMAKAIGTPFFDTLRTKQQVGYIVGSSPREHERQCFVDFIAQSNSCSTRDMLARFELFNEEFLASIGGEDLNETHFNTIRAALIDEYAQPPVSVTAKGSELAGLAFEYDDFDLKKKRIEALENLTFEDFSTFCYQNLGKQNPHRLAVLIDGDMSSSPSLNYLPIHNLSNFKAESPYLVNLDTFPQVDQP